MKKLLVVFIIILGFMFMPIANAETCENDKISIESIEVSNISQNVVEKNEPLVNGMDIKLDLEMSKVDDSIEYEMIIKNDSSSDYRFDKKSLNIESDYMEYTFETRDKTNIVKAKSSNEAVLRIQYRNKVPDELLGEGHFNENKTINIGMNNGKILNPKTRQSILFLIGLVLIIAIVSLRIVKKKNKLVLLLLGIVILPFSVYALCNININIESNIQIEKNYTIVFDTNGGSTIEPITLPAGATITPPTNPVKDGYSFVGWDVEIPSEMPSEDIVITAIWTKINCTVTLNTNGGTINNNSLVYTCGSQVGNISAPTKTDYIFVGWYLDSALKTALNSNYLVNDDIEIYAKWKSTKYLIKMGYYNYQGQYQGEIQCQGDISGMSLGLALKKCLDRFMYGPDSNAPCYSIEGCCNRKATISYAQGYTYSFYNLSGNIMSEDEGVYNCTHQGCLSGDTEVEVYDKKRKKRRRKKLRDVTPDDLILCWDFDNGELVFVEPLWIMEKQIFDKYYLLEFSDGSILKIAGDHKVYDADKHKFVNTVEKNELKIGSHVFNSKGEIVELVSWSVVNDSVDAYNVITKHHMNIFANGILTSCVFSNIYSIENMKYIKDGKEKITNTDLIGIDEKYVDGLRLKEVGIDFSGSKRNTIDYIKKYIDRLNEIEKQ